MSSESKKRKRTPVVLHQSHSIDTSKPTGVFQAPGKGRAGTLSIALPGSILANAPGLDLKTVLAGRIARAAAVFCVDEIIIFDDGQSEATLERASGAGSSNKRQRQEHEYGRDRSTNRRDPNALLELLLSYSECPPYLRKALFEYNADLGKSGLLPSLDVPHHLKAEEWCQFREAVSVGPISNHSTTNGDSTHKRRQQAAAAAATLVDAGFPVTVPAEIPPHTRLTIKFADAKPPKNWPSITYAGFDDLYNNSSSTAPQPQPQISAHAVDPAAPREQAGYYWGYTVRRATSLSAVFTECAFEDGYDVSIGTSERGEELQQHVLGREATNPLPTGAAHVLLVVGGVAGLEIAVEADASLADKGITRDNVGDLFDYYVNVCPGQGSRTIRTEEAIWIALGQLRSWIISAL